MSSLLAHDPRQPRSLARAKASSRFTFFLRALAFLVLAFFARTSLAQTPHELPPDVPSITTDGALTHIPRPPESFVRREIDGWLNVAYDAAAAPRLEPVLKHATQFRDNFAHSLGQPMMGKVELRVTRSFEEMAALAPDGAPPPAYAVAVAYPGLHYMMLSLAPPTVHAETPDIEASFEHELSHIALFDAVAGKHVPLWFNEGLAMWNAHETWTHVKTMSEASFSKSFMPFSDLDRRFPSDRASIAYAQSADFMRFLMRRTDEARFRALVARVKNGDNFYASMTDTYGSDFRKLEYQWREDVAQRYPFWTTLFAGGSIVWVFGSIAIVIAYVKRKKRQKAILAQWEKEEELEDRQAILAVEDPAPMPTKVPRVEHEGEWYTLH